MPATSVPFMSTHDVIEVPVVCLRHAAVRLDNTPGQKLYDFEWGHDFVTLYLAFYSPDRVLTCIIKLLKPYF